MGDLAREILPVNIEDEMKTAYLDYSMSVIVGRALPDVRDGLKPVNRRILYAMRELRLSSSGGFRKSAKISGDVMGNYHPHGDAAIYDAMARLAQDFNVRYPLVDGQGNFGNIDGDNPAASRYTEARLTAAAEAATLDGVAKGTATCAGNGEGQTISRSDAATASAARGRIDDRRNDHRCRNALTLAFSIDEFGQFKNHRFTQGISKEIFSCICIQPGPRADKNELTRLVHT